MVAGSAATGESYRVQVVLRVVLGWVRGLRNGERRA
jgi:hypothetical protein